MPRPASPGRALMLIAVGHTLWGLVAYRKPLREIARAGFVDSVGDGIFRRAHSDDGRAAAFWFMMAGPLAGTLGYLADVASRAGDAPAMKAGGRATVALGVVGMTVMPRSGFVMVPPLGWWLIRESKKA
jgi:hypothetical protein